MEPYTKRVYIKYKTQVMLFPIVFVFPSLYLYPEVV